MRYDCCCNVINNGRVEKLSFSGESGRYLEKFHIEMRFKKIEGFLNQEAERLKDKPKRRLKLIKEQQRLLERLIGVKQAIAEQELEEKKQRVPLPYSMGW